MKKRLFIIGNGFDLAHRLNSDYPSFKNYLEKEYKCTFNRQLISPNVIMGNQGEEVTNKKEAAQFLYNLIQTTLERNELEWKDFENSLSYINLSETFDWNLFLEYSDDPIRSESIKQLNTELLCKDLLFLIPSISNLFQEWIENDVQPRLQDKTKFSYFNSFIDLDKDVFMSFNYTTTLETLYGTQNVFHIHGKVGDEKLIIGHGYKNEANYDYENSDVIEDTKYDTELSIINMLRKPVNDVIKNNKILFDSVSELSEIIIIGWGYCGKVDYPYFEEIINKKDDAEWTLTYYDDPNDKFKAQENEDVAKTFAKNFNLKNFKIIKSSEMLK